MKKTASILAFLLIGLTSVYGQKITTYQTEKVKGCWNKYYCGSKGDDHFVLGSDTKNLYLVKFDKNYKLVNSIQLDFKEDLWTFSRCFISDNAVNLIYFDQNGYYSKSFNFDGSLKKELTLKERPKNKVLNFELVSSENKKFFALFDISPISEIAISNKKTPSSLIYKSEKRGYDNGSTSKKIKIYDASFNVIEEINLDQNIRIESVFLSDEGVFYYIDFASPQTTLVKRFEGQSTKQNLKFSGEGETHICLKQIKDKIAITYTYGITDYSYNILRFNTTGFSFNLLNSKDLSYIYETSFDVTDKDINSMLSEEQVKHPKSIVGLDRLKFRDMFLTSNNEIILYLERDFLFNYTSYNHDLLVLKLNGNGRLNHRYFSFPGNPKNKLRSETPFINLLDDKINLVYNVQRGEVCEDYIKVLDSNFKDLEEKKIKTFNGFSHTSTKINDNKYIGVTGIQKDIEITVIEF